MHVGYTVTFILILF